MLNADQVFSHEEQALLDVCVHPKYEWGDPGAFISAFNMTSEAGQRVYGAFVSFLAERYTRADQKYGRIGGGVIISMKSTCRPTGATWADAGEGLR